MQFDFWELEIVGVSDGWRYWNWAFDRLVSTSVQRCIRKSYFRHHCFWSASVWRQSNDFQRTHQQVVWLIRNIKQCFSKSQFEVVLLHDLILHIQTLASFPRSKDNILLTPRTMLRFLAFIAILLLRPIILHLIHILVWHRIQKRPSQLIGLQQLRLPCNNVIRVEALVVDTDRVHLVLLQINLDVVLAGKSLVAHRTTCIVQQPVINALWMENVEAAEHSALWIILDRFNADDAFLDEIFSIFHAYKCFFQFLVCFWWEVLVDGVLGSSDALSAFRVRSSSSPTVLIVVSVPAYSGAVPCRRWLKWRLTCATFVIDKIILLWCEPSLLFQLLSLTFSAHKKIKLVGLLSFKFSQPFPP